jgi:S-methylmethionine-dependent homocysteine/selenocysteine methylase
MLMILDGGMGGELTRRGAQGSSGLWSAQALLDAPEIVVQVHKDYIAAGARMITTNSYSTIPSYLGKGDLAYRYVELTTLAGELARRAVNESDSGAELVEVAGSIPPLSESYRPDLVPGEKEAMPIYEAMVKALAPNVDLFLCETMSSGAEAVHAVKEVRNHGDSKPVYVSWTLNEQPGKGLRSGESVAAAFALLQDFKVDGFLFNCTHPEAILYALKELAPLTDKPIGGYPNRLNTVDPEWTLDNEIQTGLRDDINVEFYLEMAHQFEEAGAAIIGGCCGIGPEYIAALAQSQKR